MALNKKSCARIAAVIVNEFSPTMAPGFVTRITKAANTNNRSFRKTMRRIAKAIKNSGKRPRAMKPRAVA